MRGKAFGLITSAQQFGGVVGPLVGSGLGSFLPIRYVLFLVGLVYLLASCYTWFMKDRLRLLTVSRKPPSGGPR
jgi:MFS transporter, DHA1 family, multidrug resistance protein